MAEGDEIEGAPKITMELAMKVIGTLATLLLGVVIWVLQTSIEDTRALQRQVDLHIANIEPRMVQAESELDNLWIMKNESDKEKLQDVKDQGLFYVDMMGKIIWLESKQEFLLKEYDK